MVVNQITLTTSCRMEAPKERTLRASKYPMMDFDKAISLLEGISIEPKVETLRLSAEIVGRVLAQDVMSRVSGRAFFTTKWSSGRHSMAGKYSTISSIRC